MTALHRKIPICYFHLLSKVFMNFSCTRVYQNQACDFSKVPSTRAYEVLSNLPFNQFFILIRFLRFLWIHLWLCQWFWTLFFPNFIQVMDMPAAWLVNCLLGYCRECVRAGAAGARTRRSLGHHLLHPLILRLLVPAVLRTRALQDAPVPADSNS